MEAEPKKEERKKKLIIPLAARDTAAFKEALSRAPEGDTRFESQKQADIAERVGL